jgi:hypothetical protein
MAKCADAVALFPGGRGTENMYQEALKAGLIIYDFRLAAPDPLRERVKGKCERLLGEFD